MYVDSSWGRLGSSRLSNSEPRCVEWTAQELPPLLRRGSRRWHRPTASHGSAAPGGCTPTGGASSIPRAAAAAMVRVLRDAVRHRRDQQHLLPAAGRETVEGWAAQAPPGFVYAVKLGAFGSHRMKLRDAGSWLPNHLDRVRRLGASLGPTLVQLPPRWQRNVERLDEFLAVAPERPALGGRAARPVVAARRRVRGARAATAPRCASTTCSPDHPVGAHRPTGPTCASTARCPRPAVPGPLRRATAVAAGGPAAPGSTTGVDVYAYFNNDDSGHAVDDARWLARPAPQPLDHAYRIGRRRR